MIALQVVFTSKLPMRVNAKKVTQQVTVMGGNTATLEYELVPSISNGPSRIPGNIAAPLLSDMAKTWI